MVFIIVVVVVVIVAGFFFCLISECINYDKSEILIFSLFSIYRSAWDTIFVFIIKTDGKKRCVDLLIP